MALTQEKIDAAVERYWRELDRYTKLAEFIGNACQKLLGDNVIRGSVQWRPKNPDRLRMKLMKQMAEKENEDRFTDVDSVFSVLKDLAGVRVTAYVETDRARLVELVQKRFIGFGSNNEVDAVTKDSETNYYRAIHCQVSMREEDLVGRYENLKGLGCEVQVCSMLAHVYNEIEHDLRYKTLNGELTKLEDGMLDILGKLMETGDAVIMETLDAVELRQKKNESEFEDAYDFVARMREFFPRASNFRNNAGQLYEVCKRLGLDTPQKLQSAIGWDDESPTTAESLANELGTRVNTNQNIQLKMDPLSSDQLLMLVLTNAGLLAQLRTLYPSGWGKGRPPRFISLANQLDELRREQPTQEGV
jgi:ppGpp synthetase/RelA/SpoT-type nucleotidyltranferase